ncbi:hypothetical protein J6590_020362, partial [Homalodisca vitripennis]
MHSKKQFHIATQPAPAGVAMVDKWAPPITWQDACGLPVTTTKHRVQSCAATLLGAPLSTSSIPCGVPDLQHMDTGIPVTTAKHRVQSCAATLLGAPLNTSSIPCGVPDLQHMDTGIPVTTAKHRVQSCAATLLGAPLSTSSIPCGVPDLQHMDTGIPVTTAKHRVQSCAATLLGAPLSTSSIPCGVPDLQHMDTGIPVTTAKLLGACSFQCRIRLIRPYPKLRAEFAKLPTSVLGACSFQYRVRLIRPYPKLRTGFQFTDLGARCLLVSIQNTSNTSLPEAQAEFAKLPTSVLGFCSFQYRIRLIRPYPKLRPSLLNYRPRCS